MIPRAQLEDSTRHVTHMSGSGGEFKSILKGMEFFPVVLRTRTMMLKIVGKNYFNVSTVMATSNGLMKKKLYKSCYRQNKWYV